MFLFQDTNAIKFQINGSRVYNYSVFLRKSYISTGAKAKRFIPDSEAAKILERMSGKLRAKDYAAALYDAVLDVDTALDAIDWKFYINICLFTFVGCRSILNKFCYYSYLLYPGLSSYIKWKLCLMKIFLDENQLNFFSWSIFNELFPVTTIFWCQI